MTIRIGIGGWTYAPWRETFYPKELPQKRELEYASSKFEVLEINSTFYSRQSLKSWEKWRDTVPDGFEFAIKGSRFCVTRTRLCDAGEGIATFFAQGMAALGPKLGPIMWQFAPRRQFDRDDIAGFIDLLPETLDGLPLRHAIEPRHDSFRDDTFFDLCKARNIAVVFDDSDKFACIEADTADFTYARLQRMQSDVTTGYNQPSLDALAKRARAWSKGGRDSYILLINGAKERAPAAALALQERLR